MACIFSVILYFLLYNGKIVKVIPYFYDKDHLDFVDDFTLVIYCIYITSIGLLSTEPSVSVPLQVSFVLSLFLILPSSFSLLLPLVLAIY